MANELKGLQRLRGLVAERDGHGGDIPVWLALEWIDDAIKRVADEPRAPHSEIAWLIEQSFDGVAHWWYGSDFIADANQAVRFCRSADANTVIMERGLVDAKAVEHMWHEMPAHD